MRRPVRRPVRKAEENKEAEALGKSHAAIGEKREAARGAGSATAIIQDLARNNARSAEADFTRQRIAVVPRRLRRKARVRRATARKETGKEIKKERHAGRVSHSGDKEAGRETAPEVREEKTVERATKSRTQ